MEFIVGICGYQIQCATPKHSISLNPKRVLQYLKDLEQYSYQLLEKSLPTNQWKSANIVNFEKKFST